jgi:hypothetical protein
VGGEPSYNQDDSVAPEDMATQSVRLKEEQLRREGASCSLLCSRSSSSTDPLPLPPFPLFSVFISLPPSSPFSHPALPHTYRGVDARGPAPLPARDLREASRTPRPRRVAPFPRSPSRRSTGQRFARVGLARTEWDPPWRSSGRTAGERAASVGGA